MHTNIATRFRTLANYGGDMRATVVSPRTVMVQGPGGSEIGDCFNHPEVAHRVRATLGILRNRAEVVEVVPAGTVLLLIPTQSPLYRQGDLVVCPRCAALAEDEDGLQWLGTDEGEARCGHTPHFLEISALLDQALQQPDEVAA